MIKKVIRIMALVLMILFFVPTAIVSCDHSERAFRAEISPCNAAIGFFEYELDLEKTETYPEKRDGSYILFLLPLLSGVMACGTINKPIHTIISALLNIIIMIWMNKYLIVKVLQDKGIVQLVEIEYTFAYRLYIVINLAIIIAVSLTEYEAKNKDGQY